MKTYLSIDIDYWNNDYWEGNYLNNVEYKLHSLLQRAQDIPVIAVMNHQQLLQPINNSGAERLINIDEHSDITDADIDNLECGTWVSYVKWRMTGHYIWIRPDRTTEYGSCNGDVKNWNQGTDWYKTESKYISNKNIKLARYLNDCVGIGICMSPHYSIYELIGIFKRIVKQYDIPYTKGLVREKHKRRIRPSIRPI